VRSRGCSGFARFASRCPLSPREHSVPLSVILITTGSSPPGKAGHAPVDYEYPDPNVRRLPF
jgi:hypothetical protein